MNRKTLSKSEAYKVCRYFTPASLTASQTPENRGSRARKQQMHPVTYKELIEQQERKVMLENGSLQTFANRATALRGFLRANGLLPDDVVGDEMRMRFPDALERFMNALRDEGKTSRAMSNTRSTLKPWKECVIERDTIEAMHADKATPFVQAIKSLMENHAPARVAKSAGIPRDMMYGWLRGKVPRSCSCKYVLRLEGYFGLEQNSLILLSGMKLKGVRRESIGGEPAPIEYRDILGNMTRSIFGIRPAAGSQLRVQWREFLIYKTATVPKYKRSPMGQWRISPCPITPDTDTNWWSFLDGREVASTKFSWAKYSCYLGWLRMSSEQGGQGIPANQVETFAWLVVPDYLEQYMEWVKERAGKRNRGALQFLGQLTSVIRPRFGYLRQRPEFKMTLPERYHGEDWEDMCNRQFELAEQLRMVYKKEVEVSRDSFEPIKHVISMPCPLDAVADMIQRMRADRPVGKAPSVEAVWARDLMLVKLLASNPLRKRNLAHLTWRADNTGELYQQPDKSWWIKIPKKKFKNTSGAAGDKDYDCMVQQNVWRDIEKYLFIYRQILMRHPTDLVFLTRLCKKDKHYPWTDLGYAVFRLTEKYLPRCRGIGPHAFRHLVATSILKADGGDIKTAALVLNDRPLTVERHYSGLRSNDGANRMGELLRGAFNRM